MTMTREHPSTEDARCGDAKAIASARGLAAMTMPIARAPLEGSTALANQHQCHHQCHRHRRRERHRWSAATWPTPSTRPSMCH